MSTPCSAASVSVSPRSSGSHLLYLIAVLSAGVTAPFLSWRSLADCHVASVFLSPFHRDIAPEPVRIPVGARTDSLTGLVLTAILGQLRGLIRKARHFIRLDWIFLASVPLMVACGTIRVDGENVGVNVSPASATLLSNQTQQFTAAVSRSPNTGVTRSATAGSIDASGIYRAPAVNSQTDPLVAGSTADSIMSASAAITGDAKKNVHITTGNLPEGQVGSPYYEVFTATGGTAPYSWSVSAGTAPPGIAMYGNGDFGGTPTAAGTSSFTVAVTDANGRTATGNYSVLVSDPPLAIMTGTFPQGEQGVIYFAGFSATGGTEPYGWSLHTGSLPPGITLIANGNLSGTPRVVGTSNFSVTVTDATGATATGAFTFTVVANSGYDGPAQLPIAAVPSTMADSPAPGAVINVKAGGDLQSALNNAQCGDVIRLQAGATFTGMFTLPNNNCNDSNWIIIRTSSPYSDLPAEGSRVTPCYAGVSSLVGRPAYPCNDPQNVLAKVEMANTGNGPFQLANGASFYRFIGLEITRANGIEGNAALISLEGTANEIILDRSWLHGNPQDETSDGFAMSGGTSIAVIDSYFNDFHCISDVGSCTDAHSVSGGISDTQDGPYLIQDNFLEASGEGIIFGGGAATKTPTDISIVGNHFWKPWQWMPGNSQFVGGPTGKPFIVKNHMELKNAVRVLIDANLMDNVWGGFSQTGFGVLICPKNQHTESGANVCPLCQVTDVTLRYSQISHAGGGIQLATSLSGNGQGGAPALAGTRWSIHDIVMDDLSKQYVGGGGAFEITNGWRKNPLNTVTVNHITAFPDAGGHLATMGNLLRNKSMYGFVFQNTLILTGRYPIWDALGSKSSCAAQDVPAPTITSCFASYTFSNNGLIATPSQFPPSSWPTGNYFPSTPEVVQFVNYNNGNGGNYELLPSSPYKNLGTDGKDLGADILGLDASLANVE